MSTKAGLVRTGGSCLEKNGVEPLDTSRTTTSSTVDPSPLPSPLPSASGIQTVQRKAAISRRCKGAWIGHGDSVWRNVHDHPQRKSEVIWQIVAVLRRYGFQRTTILGQRSDSRRPIIKENGRLRWMPSFLPSGSAAATLRVCGRYPYGMRL